jgi:hypothetical protein
MLLCKQIKPEEKMYFNRQIKAEYQKLIAIRQGHLGLQAFPIGLPDAMLTQQFRKKKIHGLTDARGLTGAELAAVELKKREALARAKRVATPDANEDEDTGLVLFTTPPRPAGESQGGTTISLALRPSPEQSRRRPAVPAPFQLFPRDDEEEFNPALLPASTAPPRLEEEGRVKRRRVHTNRYKDAVAQGDLDESQHGKA